MKLPQKLIISVVKPSEFNVMSTKKEDVEKAIQSDVLEFGQLDVYINNAGISIFDPVEDISEKDASSLLEINVLGSLYGNSSCCKGTSER